MQGRQAAAWLAAVVFAAVGGPGVVRRRRRHSGDHRVAILEYHDVCNDPGRNGAVAERRFRRHLTYLKRHYDVVSLSEAVGRLAARHLDRDTVVVTLDDGYSGNHDHAWPILRAERVPATVFVTTGFVDGRELWFDLADRCLDAMAHRSIDVTRLSDPALRQALGGRRARRQRAKVRAWLKTLPPDRRDAMLDELRALCAPLSPPARPLGWDQVRAMGREGIEIGCHTVSHPILSSLAPGDQRAEIASARARITDETGISPEFFAYPNGDAGDFTAETVDLVREAGFRAACTTIRAPNRPGCDLFRLGRIGVGDEPAMVLAARLAGLFDEAVRGRLRRWYPGWPCVLENDAPATFSKS
jgi:peptidoglycan/xylan/chitin deacetylase (PgdA/CDA1 family)